MWGCEKTKILILEKNQLNSDINLIKHIKTQIWVESKALSLLKSRLFKMKEKMTLTVLYTLAQGRASSVLEHIQSRFLNYV